MSSHLILLDFITRTIFGEQYRSLSSSLCSFLHCPVTPSLLAPNITLNTLLSNTFLPQRERPSIHYTDPGYKYAPSGFSWGRLSSTRGLKTMRYEGETTGSRGCREKLEAPEWREMLQSRGSATLWRGSSVSVVPERSFCVGKRRRCAEREGSGQLLQRNWQEATFSLCTLYFRIRPVLHT